MEVRVCGYFLLFWVDLIDLKSFQFGVSGLLEEGDDFCRVEESGVEFDSREKGR